MNYPQKIEEIFNSFNGNNLSSLDGFYSPSVEFEDPVTKVHGLENLKRYYKHAYKNVQSIKFKFQDFIVENNHIGASWTMTVKIKGFKNSQEYTVPGFSLFKFNQDGQVIFHRDYLDMGALVYEHIPVIGKAISYIKKFLRHEN